MNNYEKIKSIDNYRDTAFLLYKTWKELRAN